MHKTHALVESLAAAGQGLTPFPCPTPPTDRTIGQTPSQGNNLHTTILLYRILTTEPSAYRSFLWRHRFFNLFLKIIPMAYMLWAEIYSSNQKLEKARGEV